MGLVRKSVPYVSSRYASESADAFVGFERSNLYKAKVRNVSVDASM